MKIPVVCTCGKSLNVKSEFAGKKVRCPACSQVIKVPVSQPPINLTPSPPPVGEPEIQPISQPTSEPVATEPETESFVIALEDDSDEFDSYADYEPTIVKKRSKSKSPKLNDDPEPSKRLNLRQIAFVAVSTTGALILGYFMGREHIKSQMRSALREVTLGDIMGIANSPPKPSLVTPRPLRIGEAYQAQQFSITLNSAKIDYVKIKNWSNDEHQVKEPKLILSFTITNKDERRILHFRQGHNFRLRDDVDNEVNNFSFGGIFEIIGSLNKGAEIEPGKVTTHIEAFSIPLPKTQHITLAVNMACLDGEGEIQYMIPASAIEK